MAVEYGYKKLDFEKDCFAEKFIDGDKNKDNSLLRVEKRMFNIEYVQIWPELFVNGRAIRGNI
jgi:hypothetical protein